MTVAVSACLLGINCKYNGGNNFNLKLREYLKDKDVIEFCPEVEGGLSIPRVPVELKDGRAVNSDGVDVDSEFNRGVSHVLSRLEGKDVDLVILQSRSPSCGLAHIYDGTFTGKLIEGNGKLASRLLEKGYHLLDIADL